MNEIVERLYPNDTILADDYDNRIDFLYAMWQKHTFQLKSVVMFQTNETNQRRLSLSMEDTFLSCKFQGEDCDMNEWSWYNNWDYGDCYMFDTNQIVHIKVKDGRLTLELFVGFEKLIGAISSSSGLRVYILNRT